MTGDSPSNNLMVRLAIAAILSSVAAAGFSAWVYSQLPAEVSLDQIEAQVADNSEVMNANTEAIDELATASRDAFDEVWPRLSAVEQSLSDVRTVALDAQFAVDDANDRVEEVEQNLGICLYVQELGVRYSYWSNITFGGQEYMYRCER